MSRLQGASLTEPLRFVRFLPEAVTDLRRGREFELPVIEKKPKQINFCLLGALQSHTPTQACDFLVKMVLVLKSSRPSFLSFCL